MKTTRGVPSPSETNAPRAGKPFSRRSVRARRASSAASSSAAAFASASAASSSGVFSSSIGEGARDGIVEPGEASESSVASRANARAALWNSLSDSLHWYATRPRSPRSDLASQVTTAVDSPATYRTSPSEERRREHRLATARRRRGGTSPGARGREETNAVHRTVAGTGVQGTAVGREDGARHRREVAALLLLLEDFLRTQQTRRRASGGGRAGRRLAGRPRRPTRRRRRRCSPRRPPSG